MKVLIVDDSPTMRALIKSQLSRSSQIGGIMEASNAREARDCIEHQKPNVITLDIEIPEIDGVHFVNNITRYRSIPIVIISDHISKKVCLRERLVRMGAFECLDKLLISKRNDRRFWLADLLQRAASQQNMNSNQKSILRTKDTFYPKKRVVAIGASTGGVDAIAEILTEYPENCPATLITQHMPASFCSGFAKRLNQMCQPTVKIAEHGERVKPGSVLIAPGGPSHLSIDVEGEIRCNLWIGPKTSGHRPSIDELFNSFVDLGNRAIGVILTGMGRDGASGLLRMRNSGALTIGQDAKSCVVYGMPRVALECGAVQKQLNLSEIAKEILYHCRSDQEPTGNEHE